MHHVVNTVLAPCILPTGRRCVCAMRLFGREWPGIVKAVASFDIFAKTPTKVEEGQIVTDGLIVGGI